MILRKKKKILYFFKRVPSFDIFLCQTSKKISEMVKIEFPKLINYLNLAFKSGDGSGQTVLY
jgi:hypothetical protein